MNIKEQKAEMTQQESVFVYFYLQKAEAEETPVYMDDYPCPDEDHFFKADTDEDEDKPETEDTNRTILTHDDVFVSDGLLDEKQPDASPVSWATVLPDGESVLERQMRMLSMLGVRSFALSMEEYLQDKAEKLAEGLKRCLPANCRVWCVAQNETIPDMQRVLSEAGETASVIFLPGNAVYDRRFAKILVKTEGCSAFLSKSCVNREYADQFAGIDFKHVKELGPKEKGPSWFPALSIYKINAERAAILEPGMNPLTAIEEKIGELELTPDFERKGYIRLPDDGTRLATAYREVLARDYTSRRIDRNALCMSKLPDWLEKLQVYKPLLVYDSTGADAQVGDVLSFCSIPFTKALQPDGPVSVDSVRELLSVCRKNGCDGVISVGGENAVEAAKLLRVCMRFDVEPSAEMELSRAVRWFPHISFPLLRTAVTISDSKVSEKFFGEGAVKPFHKIPEIMALDQTIMLESLIPEAEDTEDTEKTEITKRTSFSVKRILRKTLPGLLSVYKTLLLKWTYMTKRMNNQAVVFESYHGSNAICNPFAMYTAMRNCPDYNGFVYIWAVNRPKRYKYLSRRHDTKVVKRNSLKHVRALATSRFIVSNMSVPSFFRPGKEQVYINTWHGKLIKNIGMDVSNELVGGRGNQRQKKNFVKNSTRFTYLLSPASVFTPWLVSAFDLKRLHREEIIRETGYPRNDFLFTFTDSDVLRVKLRLGIPLNRKVVLYAPTWRAVDYQNTGYVYQNPIDFSKLKEELGDEYVILFRAHNLEAASIDFIELGNAVIDVTDVRDVNDLLIVSDLLISDYSGIIYDYANLKRPIILFHYDREDYINHQTGVYIDLDVLPGYVVTDGKELGKAIPEAIRTFTYDEKYRHFNEVYNGLDGADCGLRTVQELIPPNLTPTERQRRIVEVRRKIVHAKCHVNAFLRTTGLVRKANDRRILSYKNKHKGERCFLVGNGPSLRLEDLESIRNEYSFACNKIYKSFDRTNWRPTYYFFTDRVFESELGRIRRAFNGPLFSNGNFNKPKYEKYDITCAPILNNPEYYVHGNMLEYYVPSAATVMTFMIEMAMYMGFSEIYLIGVDCSNSFVSTNDHFMNGYMTKEMETVEQRRTRELATGDRKLTFEELGQYRVDRSMAAYEKLREYADRHGIKVYNATRGGMLEAFERVDIDSMELK